MKLTIQIVDDFLAKEDIEGIRDFTVNNLISDRPKYGGGYISIQLEECPLFHTLTETVKEKVPVIQDLEYFEGWIFVYDQECPGVTPHADPGKYNVNIWCTPDESIEDTTKNGLLIYDVFRPEDWHWGEYNRHVDKIRGYLEEQEANPYLVSYKYNRATIFNSGLFHETDDVSTKPGDSNKRINMTFMYR